MLSARHSSLKLWVATLQNKLCARIRLYCVLLTPCLVFCILPRTGTHTRSPLSWKALRAAASMGRFSLLPMGLFFSQSLFGTALLTSLCFRRKPSLFLSCLSVLPLFASLLHCTCLWTCTTACFIFIPLGSLSIALHTLSHCCLCTFSHTCTAHFLPPLSVSAFTHSLFSMPGFAVHTTAPFPAHGTLHCCCGSSCTSLVLSRISTSLFVHHFSPYLSALHTHTALLTVWVCVSPSCCTAGSQTYTSPSLISHAGFSPLLSHPLRCPLHCSFFHFTGLASLSLLHCDMVGELFGSLSLSTSRGAVFSLLSHLSHSHCTPLPHTTLGGQNSASHCILHTGCCGTPLSLWMLPPSHVWVRLSCICTPLLSDSFCRFPLHLSFSHTLSHLVLRLHTLLICLRTGCTEEEAHGCTCILSLILFPAGLSHYRWTPLCLHTCTCHILISFFFHALRHFSTFSSAGLSCMFSPSRHNGLHTAYLAITISLLALLFSLPLHAYLLFSLFHLRVVPFTASFHFFPRCTRFVAFCLSLRLHTALSLHASLSPLSALCILGTGPRAHRTSFTLLRTALSFCAHLSFHRRGALHTSLSVCLLRILIYFTLLTRACTNASPYTSLSRTSPLSATRLACSRCRRLLFSLCARTRLICFSSLRTLLYLLSLLRACGYLHAYASILLLSWLYLSRGTATRCCTRHFSLPLWVCRLRVSLCSTLCSL